MKPHEYATATGADVIGSGDVALLSVLEEEGLLGELGRKFLDHRRRLVAEVDAALAELRSGSNKRKRNGRIEHLRDEPTPGRDELAVFVLRDPLGSTLASVATTLGESGSGTNATRWVWDPGAGALGFVDRAVWSSIRRDRALADRLVTLDPGKGRGASWADLWGLVATSPARVHHLDDVAKAVVRGTSSAALLELWFNHPGCSRDPARLRVAREQLVRVKRTAAAE